MQLILKWGDANKLSKRIDPKSASRQVLCVLQKKLVLEQACLKISFPRWSIVRQFEPVDSEADGIWPVIRAVSGIPSLYDMCRPTSPYPSSSVSFPCFARFWGQWWSSTFLCTDLMIDIFILTRHAPHFNVACHMCNSGCSVVNCYNITSLCMSFVGFSSLWWIR